ncbi:hypothetical protein JOC36_000547 [Weissella uvarum]|uniref:hypothetical protein n=1 Tax=Weissella uvarum TaxID=1479233 RepID=UPI00196148E5|nr:hypothetical protein [Weissella uvarum]MBM7616998.1 hypothetical protein [Weissella uvarum]MCM0595296.1 hypothetical protein [Weissella uvarum]
MIERVEEDQQGTYIRLPKEVQAKKDDQYDVVKGVADTVILHPVPKANLANNVLLEELFKNWQGIYEPEFDEWVEDEESKW